MVVREIEVTNLGAIDDLYLEVDSTVTVIAGPNGVGKSTMFEGVAKELEESPHSSSVNVRSESDTTPVYISPHRAPTSADMNENLLTQLSEREYVEALSTRYTLSDEHFSSNSLPSAFSSPQSTINRSRTEADFAPYYELKRRLAELMKKRSNVAMSMIDSGEVVSKEDIPNPLDHIKSAIDFLLPGAELVEITVEDRDYEITFNDRQGEKIGFDELSSGERDVIAIAFPLLEAKIVSEIADVAGEEAKQEDLFVLLDSPEAYLHPSLQERLLEYIDRIDSSFYDQSDQNLQVIMCTHSQMILENTTNESLYFLLYPDQRPDGQNNQLKSSEEIDKDLLDSVSGDLGFAALSSGKPLLLLEGKSDRKMLRKLYPGLENEIELVPMGSKSNVRGVSRAFNELFPQLSSMGVEVAAVIDRDRDPNLDQEVEERVFVLPVTCMENLLLLPDPLYRSIDTIADDHRLDSLGLESAEHVEGLFEEIVQTDEFKKRELKKRIGESLSMYVDVSDLSSLSEEELVTAIDDIVEENKNQIEKTVTRSREQIESSISDRDFDSLNGKIIMNMMAGRIDVSSDVLIRSTADKMDPTTLPEDLQTFLQDMM